MLALAQSAEKLTFSCGEGGGGGGYPTAPTPPPLATGLPRAKLEPICVHVVGYKIQEQNSVRSKTEQR